jgi:hypothetical protein
MNTSRRIVQLCIVVAVCFGLGVPRSHAAGADEPIPGIIEDGFKAWAAKGTAYNALDIWKKGGLLETDAKPMTLTRYFSQMDHSLGKYKSFESVQTKTISQSSHILYLAINFEHGAIFGRFLLYRTDKDWVVQNMDFSSKPEALMPWLAFTGENYDQ